MKLTKFQIEDEEERIDLVNKVVKNCQQDEIYLRDIIHFSLS